MDINFVEIPADSVSPVIFEKVIGEKPGGGMVANPTFDIAQGTAVGINAGAIKPIKAYRLLKAVAAIDTTIDIAKGSGVAVGDAIGNGALAVAGTALDSTNATKDVVTVTLGIVIAIGTVLYQAAAASEAAAVPIYTPSYLTGAMVYAGQGDKATKLVAIAIVRKETVNASPEVLALLTSIKAV